MLYERLYLLTSFTCAIVAIVLAVVLAGIRIGREGALRKYGKARWCLAGAFAGFGAFNLFEVLLSSDGSVQIGSLTASLIIVIGAFMAMFITMTMLAFIRPELVGRKAVLVQLAVMVPPCMLLILLNVTSSQSVFRICFVVMLVAYLALLVYCTRLFVLSYRLFNEKMLAVYQEEDLVPQLHWINWTFWLALAVGILALLLLNGSLLLQSVLTVVFTVCFIIIGISFINYRYYAPLVDRAFEDKPENVPYEDKGEVYAIDSGLRDALDAWIRRKGYLDNTKAVDDISHELGFWEPTLQEYIHQTTGEDFRTWRIRLRIQEAERIISSNPKIPISQVVAMAGFNDRAFFYRSFQKITGRSLKEFRDTLA